MDKKILEEIARTYAPRIYWSAADPFVPADPSDFIQNSSLRFHHDWFISDEIVVHRGRIIPKELGFQNTGMYREQAANGCSLDGPYYSPSNTNPVTQPHHPDGIEGGNEGFFLDYEEPTYGTGEEREWCYEPLQDKKYTAALAQGVTPIFWRLGRENFVNKLGSVPSDTKRILIEYWYFSNYSHAWEWCVGNHEGDWEGMAVMIDFKWEGLDRFQHKPIGAIYAQHESSRWYCASEVNWVEGSQHPVAYSARGIHATYAKPGIYERDFPRTTDYADGDRSWDTWVKIESVEEQDWYGFTGGWGEVGTLYISSGFMGPSPAFTKFPYSHEEQDSDRIAAFLHRCGLD